MAQHGGCSPGKVRGPPPPTVLCLVVLSSGTCKFEWPAAHRCAAAGAAQKDTRLLEARVAVEGRRRERRKVEGRQWSSGRRGAVRGCQSVWLTKACEVSRARPARNTCVNLHPPADTKLPWFAHTL